MKLQAQVNCIVLAIAAFCIARTASGQGIDYQLGVGYNSGNSIGLDDGFSRFEAWLPLAQPVYNSVIYTDLRFLLFNDNSDAMGVNAGIGGRWYDTIYDRIYGGYAYYDTRDTGQIDYEQVTFGIESLGRIWDFRFNAHLPFGNESTLVVGPNIEANFVNQNLVVSDLVAENAMRGFHGEAARVLYDRGTYQVRGAIGGYSFEDTDTGIQATGPRARLELRGGDEFWLSGYLQHDDQFETTAGVTAIWRFGVTGNGRCASSSASLAARLGDPVERIQHIVVQQSPSGEDGFVIATGDDGNPITFLHVDSAAAGGGDGSIEAPLNSLAAASNQPEDVVFVHGGSLFNGEAFSSNTVGQQVLGEGITHTVFTQQVGDVVLPTVNGGPLPIVQNAPGNAFTLAANDIELAGFQIESAGSNGVFATGLSGLNVHDNTSDAAGGAGFAFVNMTGANNVQDNTATSSIGAGDRIYRQSRGRPHREYTHRQRRGRPGDCRRRQRYHQWQHDHRQYGRRH